MMSHEIPMRPWQIVSMDLFNYAEKEYLILVDHYSDFWEIELLPDLSTEATVKRCKAQFAHHGQPDKVISDNGPQFSSIQFRKFAFEWEFEHVTSSPRHPQANGKAESAVKIVKTLCKKAQSDGKDQWKAILHWRNTPTVGMDSSSAQRLMSQRLKTSLPVANKLLEPSVIQGVPEKLWLKRQVFKAQYDTSARDLPELNIGERIRMKPLPGDRTSCWRMGTCLQKVAPRSYLVDIDGTLYRRNRVDLRVAKKPDSHYPVVRPDSPGTAKANSPIGIKESTEMMPQTNTTDSPEQADISEGSEGQSMLVSGEKSSVTSKRAEKLCLQ